MGVEPQSQNSFDSIDTPVDRLKKVIDCKDFNKQPEDRNPSLLLPSSFVSARKKSAGRQEGLSVRNGGEGGIQGNCVKLTRGLVNL